MTSCIYKAFSLRPFLDISLALLTKSPSDVEFGREDFVGLISINDILYLKSIKGLSDR